MAPLFPVCSAALHTLGRWLCEAGYRFDPVSVAAIKRALREEVSSESVVADLFGWGRAVEPARSPAQLRALMDQAGVAQIRDGRVASAIKASTLEGLLLFHNSGPGAAEDAVFLGPDTARYLYALASRLTQSPAPSTIVEIGCGSGAAAIWLAQRFPDARVVATDINSAALALCQVNAQLAGVASLTLVGSDGFAAVSGKFDLVVCNPPFIADRQKRTYRNGGGDAGMALPARIVRESVAHLNKHGNLLMYTASPIAHGQHVVSTLLADVPHAIDVIGKGQFDDLLGTPPYHGIDAIDTVILRAGPA